MPELQPHIQLSSDLGIRYAILPGDPARIDRVKAHLDEARELAFNREFRSAAGTYKGVPVLVLSTGIGGASAAIAAEEITFTFDTVFIVRKTTRKSLEAFQAYLNLSLIHI